LFKIRTTCWARLVPTDIAAPPAARSGQAPRRPGPPGGRMNDALTDPKRSTLRPERNKSVPEALTEALKRTAANMRERRPMGHGNSGPYWNGPDIPDDLEEWRGRAIAGPLPPSGVRHLKNERPNDVGDEKNSVTFELAHISHLVYKRLRLHRVGSAVASDPHLKSVWKRNASGERGCERKTEPRAG
jgi:hypothetical protein